MVHAQVHEIDGRSLDPSDPSAKHRFSERTTSSSSSTVVVEDKGEP